MRKLKLLVKNLIMKSLTKILVKIFFRVYRGDNFYFMLRELDRLTGEQIKHNIYKLSSEQTTVFLLAREKIHKLLEDYKIGFNSIE